MFHIGVYINVKGEVQPCVGIVEDNPYNVLAPGNSLAAAIDRDLFTFYRDIKNKINGFCKTCSIELCYGCRAHGFWDPEFKDKSFNDRVLMDDILCPLNPNKDYMN